MARPLRIQYPGALYHVTSRGNARRAICKDAQDRALLLDILKQVNQRHHWVCHAYCLMDNHYHLVVETPEGNLSRGMRQLNGVYTQRYNWRHRGAGHIFQGRYKAVLIQKESHLLEVCRYVVLNPVRAKSVADPGKWRWSSYRATAGIDKAHRCLTADWVLGQFGERRGAAQRRYREFVREGIGGESIWGDVRAQSLLGDEDFVERLVVYAKGYEKMKEVPRSQRYLGRPPLGRLFDAGVRRELGRRNGRIREAVERHGYSQKEVADHLKMHYSTICRLVNGK